MDQKQIFKQMVEFNQATFNSSYNAMVMMQDQLERVASTTLSQAAWLPAEGREAIDNWVQSYKTGQDNFKNYMDETFKKVEEYFAG
jgi:hypothetical protein